MMGDDLFYKIALTQVPLVGAITARNLISYCGSPKAVFQASKKALLKIPGVGEQVANSILRKQPFAWAEQELQFIEKNEIQVLFYLDDDYPRRLIHFPDAPVLLYYKGQASLNHSRILAVVGTRTPTPRGKAICESILRELSDFDLLIVSGLAFGIDITAHRAALNNNLATIGVLGHGLDRIYPSQHSRTAREMIGQGGLLTEFSSHHKPDRENFPMRNRIVAGMSDAILVIETAEKGGSIITARLGNDYHKDVFAVPGRTKDPKSKGCNQLIKRNQAALVEDAEDIAFLMGWEKENHARTIQPRLFEELTPDEQLIIEHIRALETISIDILSAQTQKPSSVLASLLLGLEFKGLVKSLPGNRYVLV